MDKINKDIIIHLSEDIDVTKDIYNDISLKIGISEDELIDRIKSIKEKGYLKRIAPVIRHKKSGYIYNAMVVWSVEKEKIHKFVQIVVAIPSISHVYERETTEKWNYNFYTMIHGINENDIIDMVNKLSKEMNINDYCILNSLHELKKISPDMKQLII